MIAAVSKRLGRQRISDTKMYIARGIGLQNSKTSNRSLTQTPKFHILQDAKRLKTFFVPQEEEMYQ
jgi:hypothetical protein